MKSRTTTQRVLHSSWVFAASFVATMFVLAILALAFIARSDASTLDDEFLSSLSDQGITLGKGDSFDIGAAHAICEDLRGGAGIIPESIDLAQHASLNGNQAGMFVEISAETYCPSKSVLSS